MKKFLKIFEVLNDNNSKAGSKDLLKHGKNVQVHSKTRTILSLILYCSIAFILWMKILFMN